MIVQRVLGFMLTGALLLGSPGKEEDPTLRLRIGHPRYRDSLVTVEPDTIISARTGKPMAFEDMIRDMGSCRLVFVGETHNSLPMHRIQARIIEALAEQDPELAVGMEMFSTDLQTVLNRWSLAILDEAEFIREIEWYLNWNHHFGFYRDILALARDRRLPIHALNVRREVISRIRMRGWASLNEAERALVPEPDLGHAEHRRLIRAVFENMEMPPQMRGAGLDMVFEGLYRAQSAWDEVMARNAERAVRVGGRRMVVLAGSGHLIYNLGINRRAFERTRWPYRTVVCVAIPEGTDSLQVSRSLADFVWGIHEEKRPAYPSIGLAFETFEGLANPVISRAPRDGVARDSGFEQGDVILGVGGRCFDDINSLRIFLSGFDWGSEVEFRVLRAGREKQITLTFTMPEDGGGDDSRK